MNDIGAYYKALDLLKPEIVVIIGVLLTSVWDLFFPQQKAWTPRIALLCLGIASWILFGQFSVSEKIFAGIFTVDSLTVCFSLIATIVGAMVVFLTMGYEHHFKRNRGEFYAILLTATVSVMFLSGSTDLIMLFVSLETLSICCVLLAGFEKSDVKSGEASLKYLLSTAATTATLLYALSFIYGITGATTFDQIAQKMMFHSVGASAMIKFFVIALTLSAIGFKLSLVPFHMWTPDVYEGAPTPVTAFLSIGSKAGGFALALRLLIEVFGAVYPNWMIIVSFMAIVSMIAGNLIALAQSSFKRMLAYSSIAHVGYMMIGLVAFSVEGVQSMIFYVIVYGIMNLGAFAGAILFSNETGSDRIDDYAGLIRKRPVVAVLTSICLLNLAGLPIPPAGFLAKLFIFKAGLSLNDPIAGPAYSSTMYQHHAITSMPLGWILVTVALVTSIPAIYYYTRVVIKMIVPEPSEKVANLPATRAFVGSDQFGPQFALAICTIAILLAGIAVDPLMDISKKGALAVDPGKVQDISMESQSNKIQ